MIEQIAECRLNLETAVGREKDMQGIGVHGESEKLVVYAMDGVYAGNAGAIPCHLIGDESFFWFARCVKNLRGLS